MDAVRRVVGERRVVGDPHLLSLRKVKPLLEQDSVNCILHLLLGSCRITSLRFLWLNVLASNMRTVIKEEQECKERV